MFPLGVVLFFSTAPHANIVVCSLWLNLIFIEHANSQEYDFDLSFRLEKWLTRGCVAAICFFSSSLAATAIKIASCVLCFSRFSGLISQQPGVLSILLVK